MISTVKNDRLCYYNMSNTIGVSMISTVEENQNHYTQRQCERANIAREL